MSAEVLHYGGYIDGDLPRDPAAADYVAGQPCTIDANGVDVTAADADFLGIFKNDKVEDDAGGPQAADTVPTSPAVLGIDCGVIVGGNKVRLAPGTLPDGSTDTPFAFPGTGGGGWAIGDEVYIDGNGKWDNAGTTPRGKVTKIPTSADDDMHVAFY